MFSIPYHNGLLQVESIKEWNESRMKNKDYVEIRIRDCQGIIGQSIVIESSTLSLLINTLNTINENLQSEN